MVEGPIAAGIPSVPALLARVRTSWRRGAIARGLLLGTSVGAAVAVTIVAVDLLLPLPAEVRRALRLLLAAGVVVSLARLLRAAFPGPGDRRLALLLEERHPVLERALSTALEPVPDGPVARAFRARLERAISALPARLGAGPSVRRPAAALVAAAGMALLLASLYPGGAGALRERWVALADPAAAPGAGPGRRVIAAAGRPGVETGLGRVRITTEPPAYSGLPTSEWRGEEIVPVLPGSRLRVEGAGPGEGVRASVIGGPALAVRPGGRWRVERVVSSSDRGLLLESLSGGTVAGRLVVPLAILPDLPPQVELTAPARDQVLAAGRGVVTVRATARDDYGVGSFRISWIRSRGSGESFSFEEGEWVWSSLQGAGREVRGEHRLDLGALSLEPGDVLHLRASARDLNTVDGPGAGVSITRTVRIARPDEMAEVTELHGFPIEAEREPILSQRMIILMTEELISRAPGLARAALLREAAKVATEQARLREEVSAQALTPSGDAQEEEHEEEADHDHDSRPIASVNRPLLEAYNAMWSAEADLRIGELRASLPAQYRALEILQAARESERVFARGRQRATPVDVTAARGTGKLEGAVPGDRLPAPATPSPLAARAELEAALARIARLGARAAAVELSGAAARLLAHPGVDPAAPAMLVRAAEAARRGSGGEAMRLARRALALLAPRGGEAALPVRLPAAVDPASAAYFRALGGGTP